MMSLRDAVREKCLQCLDVETGRGAFDCLGASCPLYPAMPFRGSTIKAQETDTQYLSDIERLAIEVPPRRVTKAMIRRMCEQCQEGRADCEVVTCPLHSLTPFQPGGQPKRAISEDHREKLVAAGRQFQKRTG